MLKGIDPLLSPELLKILCEMGHGEEIVLVDANFTSQTLGQGKPLVRLPGIDLQPATGAATPAQCEAVERFAFYERVKGAYAIVQTGEMQPYANFLFKKGVISDPLAR